MRITLDSTDGLRSELALAFEVGLVGLDGTGPVFKVTPDVTITLYDAEGGEKEITVNRVELVAALLNL